MKNTKSDYAWCAIDLLIFFGVVIKSCLVMGG